MAERNYPRDFIGLLPDESARWVSQGLISEAQRDGILKLYPEPVAAGRDRTVLIFSILGSLLLAAGVILFFAANWPKITATVKVACILAAVLGTYAVGYHLTYRRDDYPRLGQALILLGGLFYGAAIWLVAQIFHLDSHFPNGFLLWGAGVLPVVWATGSRPTLYLSSILLAIWTITEQTEFASLNFFYPGVMLGLLLPTARKWQDWFGEATVLGGLFLWFAMNVAAHGDLGHWSNGPLVIGRLLLLYGVAVTAAGLGGLGDLRAYLSVGSILALGGSYMLTFNLSRPASEPPYPHLLAGNAYLIVGTAVILMGLLAAGWTYARQGGPEKKYLLPALAVLAVAGATAELPGEVTRMIGFNLLLFGGTVGMVIFGIARRMGWVVNLGLIIFGIHVLTRYFDFFFSAMNRSLFFMVGGVILLGGGWLLERNRRRWMQDMGGGGNVG